MDGAISKMKDNSKLDAVPIRNLGEFSRGEAIETRAIVR
jgi:hypothetical protein